MEAYMFLQNVGDILPDYRA